MRETPRVSLGYAKTVKDVRKGFIPSALRLTWIANMRMHFERAWERSPMIRKA